MGLRKRMRMVVLAEVKPLRVWRSVDGLGRHEPEARKEHMLRAMTVSTLLFSGGPSRLEKQWR